MDQSGNIVFAGGFSGTVDFGAGKVTSAGTSDTYLVKLDPGAAYLWSTHFGSTGAFTSTASLAPTISGNTLATGGFSGTVDFGSGAVSSKGTSDVFLASLGASAWSKHFAGGAAADIAAGVSVATDGEGNILLTGNFSGAVDFGGGQLLSAGGADVFLAKLDATGSHVWSKRFGDSAEQSVAGVAVDASRNVVLAGFYSGSMSFDGKLLVSAGGTDVFVAKFSP